MSVYKVGIGHDVALVSLAAINPSPRNGEAKPTERRYSDSGPVEVGLHSTPTWDVFGDAAEYQAVLAQFGLATANSAPVTFYTRNEVFNWARYNGWAVLPEIGQDGAWTQFFARGFVIAIHSLVELEG